MSSTSTMPQLLTAEEFFGLCGMLGPSELIDGRVVRTMPGGGYHGTLAGLLAALVGHYVVTRRLGRVLGAETGFVLRRQPDVVRAPDLAFIAAERAAIAATARFIEGAPDFCVEVVSQFDAIADVQDKAAMWVEAGVRLVWVVDPRTRSVSVHRPDAEAVTLAGDEVLTGEPVLPGLRVTLAELFAPLD